MRAYEFYKEDGIWYIDLLEYLEFGFGTLSNLRLVDGAEIFLDFLSNNGTKINLTLSQMHFDGYQYELIGEKKSIKNKIQKFVGFQPEELGRFYTVIENNNFKFWLGPVTEFVFGNLGSGYPDSIFIKIN